MGQTLVIAEKPSVAADIARALGGFKKNGDFWESDEMIIGAAVGHLLEHADPVHKISIISRGRALGYTLSIPDEDKVLNSVGEMRFDVVLEENGRELMRQTMVTTVYEVRIGQVEIKEDLAVDIYTFYDIINMGWGSGNPYPDMNFGGTIDGYSSAFDLIRNIASAEVSINGTDYTFGSDNYYSWYDYTQIHFGLDEPITVTDISELPQSVIAQYGEDYLLGEIESGNVYIADIKYTMVIYGVRAYEGEIEVFIVG